MSKRTKMSKIVNFVRNYLNTTNEFIVLHKKLASNNCPYSHAYIAMQWTLMRSQEIKVFLNCHSCCVFGGYKTVEWICAFIFLMHKMFQPLLCKILTFPSSRYPSFLLLVGIIFYRGANVTATDSVCSRFDFHICKPGKP